MRHIHPNLLQYLRHPSKAKDNRAKRFQNLTAGLNKKQALLFGSLAIATIIVSNVYFKDIDSTYNQSHH